MTWDTLSHLKITIGDHGLIQGVFRLFGNGGYVHYTEIFSKTIFDNGSIFIFHFPNILSGIFYNKMSMINSLH